MSHKEQIYTELRKRTDSCEHVIVVTSPVSGYCLIAPNSIMASVMVAPGYIFDYWLN